MSSYAGLVTRLAALVVDGVLLTITVPAVAEGPPSLWASMTGSAPGWLKASCQIIAAMVPVFYFAIAWWGTGQTAGGFVFGTVVGRPDGRRLSLGRAVLRAFAGLALPMVWLAGLAFTLWDPRRRALHDRLFDTVVWYKQRNVIAV